MMSDKIIITDVGPRDGLQNQPKILTIEQRFALVEAIAEAGVPHQSALGQASGGGGDGRQALLRQHAHAVVGGGDARLS